MKDLSEFEKTKEYLVCVDSDGTAIDAMTSKHKLCFGPCFVKIWKLENHSDEVLALWNEINLHGSTRGKNRFITFLLAAKRLYGRLIHEDLSALEEWINTTTALSNPSLEEYIATHDDAVLKKALAWSIDTNGRINALGYDDKKAFNGVKEILAQVSRFADIAVVSSANLSSIYEEWKYFGLYDSISVMTTQSDGTKQQCIEKLLSFGYDKTKTVMLGDAPPDLQAARDCGILFYPIMPENEVESWHDFYEKYFDEIRGGTYANSQNLLTERFLNN